MKALREGEKILEEDESLLESTLSEVSVLHGLVKNKQQGFAVITMSFCIMCFRTGRNGTATRGFNCRN